MEKDQNTNSEEKNKEAEELNSDVEPENSDNKEQVDEVDLEEKVKELEDKVARAFAEMENQRRRFEKEREDAFNYGGFAFAKETLNLIDNL